MPDTHTTSVDQQRLEKERIEDDGTVTLTRGGHAIHCLTVIGQVEGHTEAPQGQKTTKYEHVIPQLYSGQYGGFELQELDSAVRAIEAMPNVEVGGVCSFPCFLYDEAAQDILHMPNLRTVQTAAEMLRARGYRDLMLNTPSATCTHSIPMIAAAGGTHGEPGHGLTGTTPYHAGHPDAEERPGYLYVSEVSHNLGDKAYCYGGGHYRRGHMKNALVGTTPENAKVVPVLPPDDSSIDYHFELQQNCPVSAAAVMAFRTQFFVTRSRVAVVKGLSSGKPELAGLYSALGEPVRE